MTLVNEPSAAPTRKVAGVGLTGAIVVLGAMVLSSVFNVDLSVIGVKPDTLPVGEALTALLTFAAGYLRKESVG